MKLLTDIYATPARIVGLLHLIATQSDRGPLPTSAALAWMESGLSKPGGERKAILIIQAAVEASIVQPCKVGSQECLQLKIEIPSESWAPERTNSAVSASLDTVLLQATSFGSGNHLADLSAWWLCQIPTEMPQGHDQLRLAMEKCGFSLKEYGMRSPAAVDNLLYWLRYLGLSWQYLDKKAEGLVADPTRFLLRHLDELLPPGKTQSAEAFRIALSRLCPVFDGGIIRVGLLEQASRHGQAVPPADQLSASLSFALRRLRNDGHLEYGCPADQREFLMLADGEKIAFLERKEVV